MAEKLKKILILGCSGSGKSTLTRVLADILNLPIVHLDIHFWQPGWVEPAQEHWREKVKKLSQSDCWIMDGTFSESFDIRFPKADQIIVVNMPRYLCLYRAILRVFKYSKKNRRPDMAQGCDEEFDFGFYRYIWNYNKNILPKIYAALELYHCADKTIFLSTPKEVETFIQELP